MLAQGVQFTDEHVIPQAFGKFKDNLVLNQGVCGECNQFFGNNLDRILARGSLPRIARYMEGLRSPIDLNKKDHDRVRITIREESVEMPVEFVSDQDGRALAIRKSGIKYWSVEAGEWKFATTDDIKAGLERLHDLDKEHDVSNILWSR